MPTISHLGLQELRATRLECQHLHDHVTTADESAAAAEKQLDGLQAEVETAKQAAANAQQECQEVSAQLQSTEEYAVSLKAELQRRQDEVRDDIHILCKS